MLFVTINLEINTRKTSGNESIKNIDSLSTKFGKTILNIHKKVLYKQFYIC